MGIRKGFTLAEVLITLMIIGIIAAMTIPSLMNNTNEQETVVAVKKAYSVLAQAYSRIFAENGEIIPATLGETETEATKTLGEMFAKYLNAQKVCGQEGGMDCLSTQNGGMYKNFDGSDWHNWNADTLYYKMTLADGMSLLIYGYNSFQDKGTSEPLQYVIGSLDIDINGDKKPNTKGKDVFAFWITRYGIVPIGTPDDTTGNINDCRVFGGGCTAWVVSKGNVDFWKHDVSW